MELQAFKNGNGSCSISYWEPSENLEYDLDEPKIFSQEFPWNSQKKSELVNISHK